MIKKLLAAAAFMASAMVDYAAGQDGDVTLNADGTVSIKVYASGSGAAGTGVVHRGNFSSIYPYGYYWEMYDETALTQYGRLKITQKYTFSSGACIQGATKVNGAIPADARADVGFGYTDADTEKKFEFSLTGNDQYYISGFTAKVTTQDGTYPVSVNGHELNSNSDIVEVTYNLLDEKVFALSKKGIFNDFVVTLSPKPTTYTVTVTYPDYNFNTNISKTYEVPTTYTWAQVLAMESDFIPSETSNEEVTANGTYTAKGTWRGQLEFNKVYRLTIRNKAVAYSYDNSQFPTDGSNAAVYPVHFWYFTDAGKTDDNKQKVQLHNLAWAAEYGIHTNVGRDEKAYVSDEPSTYIMVQNTSATGGFTLYNAETPNTSDLNCCWVNDCGNYLGIWQTANVPNDIGQKIGLLPLVDADFDAITALGADNEKVAAAKANPTADNLRAAFASTSRYTNAAEDYVGKIVRIKAVRALDSGVTTPAITFNGSADATGAVSSRGVNQQAADATDPAQLWRVVKPSRYCQSQEVQLQNVVSGLWYGQADVATQIQWGKRLQINAPAQSHTDGQLIARVNNEDNSFINFGRDGGLGEYPEYDGDDGNFFTIEDVESLTVTIPEGQAYATACFPVDVTIGDDVKVYDIENSHKGYNTDTHYFLLRQLTGVIPAGTGFIVEGTGDIEFAIADGASEIMLLDGEEGEETVTSAASILTGITMKRAATSHADHYVLGSDGSMAKTTAATEIAANSAVVMASDLSDASHAVDTLTLTANDQSTGIAHVAADGTVSFYDLQGRSIAAPRAGIYVTSDGRKVLVK